MGSAKKLFDRAGAALESNRPKEAIELLSQAIMLEPNEAALYQNRGIAHSLNDEPRAAIADFTTALELRADHVHTLLNRGLAHFELGDHERAMEDLGRATLLPGLVGDAEVQGHYFLARSQELSGRPDLAHVEFLLVYGLSPGSGYGEDALERSARIKADGLVA